MSMVDNHFLMRFVLLEGQVTKQIYLKKPSENKISNFVCLQYRITLMAHILVTILNLCHLLAAIDNCVSNSSCASFINIVVITKFSFTSFIIIVLASATICHWGWLSNNQFTYGRIKTKATLSTKDLVGV